MAVYGWFQGKGPNGFGYNSTAEAVSDGVDLSGKRFVLTGCNSGIGRETLRVLGLRGAFVYALARTEEKGTEALKTLGVDGMAVACELSEPSSVRGAVETLRAQGVVFDGIIANAGIMALPERTVSHGHELQFLTNHIGHFILVTGLLEHLASDGRVVMLSSRAHHRAPVGGIQFDDISFEKGYDAWTSYGQSKLANLLFARHLGTRLPQPGQTANSVHPGVIWTNLGRHMPGAIQTLAGALGPALVFKSIPQGAATQTYVALHPEAAGINGEYFADCNVSPRSKYAQDADLAKRLWEATEAWVAAL